MSQRLCVEKLPVHDDSDLDHVWVPTVDFKVVHNEGSKDRLFKSIKSAKRGLARHLGVDDPESLEIKVLK